MFERLTPRAHQVVFIAQDMARELGHAWIGTEHLLLGLVGEGRGPAARVLTSYGLTQERVRGQVELLAGRGSTPASEHLPFTAEALAALEQSCEEADELHYAGVGTEQVLLGVLSHATGITSEILAAAGVEAQEARQRVAREIS